MKHVSLSTIVIFQSLLDLKKGVNGLTARKVFKWQAIWKDGRAINLPKSRIQGSECGLHVSVWMATRTAWPKSQNRVKRGRGRQRNFQEGPDGNILGREHEKGGTGIYCAAKKRLVESCAWVEEKNLSCCALYYTLCWCQHPPSALVYSLARTKCGYLILHMHLDEDGPLFNA